MWWKKKELKKVLFFNNIDENFILNSNTSIIP